VSLNVAKPRDPPDERHCGNCALCSQHRPATRHLSDKVVVRGLSSARAPRVLLHLRAHQASRDPHRGRASMPGLLQASFSRRAMQSLHKNSSGEAAHSRKAGLRYVLRARALSRSVLLPALCRLQAQQTCRGVYGGGKTILRAL